MALVETYAILICKVSLKNIPWNHGIFSFKKIIIFQVKDNDVLEEEMRQVGGALSPSGLSSTELP